MAQSDQSYSAGMMAVKQAQPEELAAAHWRQTQSLQALAERQDAELAALRAEVARLQEAVRAFGADCAAYVAESGEIPSGPFHRLAALGVPAPDAEPLIDGYTAAEWAPVGVDTPTPPADAPLPGPVADAVDALRGVGAHYTADALAAWARAQQPALGDDVREVMREAADRLGTWQRYRGRIEAARASDLALAARLRELAGERGRGFATIPGWRAGEP